MVVYYSILAYTVVIAGIGQFIKRQNAQRAEFFGNEFNNSKPISLLFAVLSMALLVFFVAKRTDYQDTFSYIDNFRNVTTDLSIGNLKEIYDTEDSGIGYVFLEMVFKKYISTDFSDWFMFLAIFQAGAFISLAYRFSSNYLLSAFLFVASTEFTWMMNGIRQFTAVCLIMYFFSFVTNRKLIPFLIVVFIAYTIHSTALFWIPVYFIVRYKPFSRQIWLFVVLTLIVVFFIDNFTNLLDSSLEDTQYAGTGATIMNYENDDGVSPIRVLVSAVPPGIALWRKKYVEQRSNPTIDIMINMSTASVGIYLLAMVTSGILVGRVPAYFTMVNYILLPWLLDNTFEGGFKTFIKTACYSFYLVYFYYSMAVQSGGHYVSTFLGLSY